ncbi:MAG: ABC transporter ATP-binding protein [archaeon]|nr:ABC transporter ATP-binding protein [archaeon]
MSVNIKAVDLGVSYGESVVWKDINVEIEGPGLVGILGPNGVGKSTFMYTLNKILEPTTGKVFIDGRDLAEMDHKEIAKSVAYVPQQSNETFAMSVIDTVLMGRYPVSGFNTSDEDVMVAAKCLKMMEITNLAMRNFNELSAGQHQKVMIARGLAQEPKVLLLDEPTSNLDIYHQMYVMNLLKEIAHAKDMIVVVICHDLNVASKFCDRLLLFSKGCIVADGTSEDVITSKNIKDVYNVTTDVVTVDGRPYAVYHNEGITANLHL